MARIYVASLTDYNAGILHGVWIDLHATCSDSEDVESQIQAMLASSTYAKRTGETAEEWRVDDSEGFGKLDVSSIPLAELCGVSELLEEYAPIIVETAYDAVRDFDKNTLDVWVCDHYLGQHDSMAAFAESLLEDSGELNKIPEHLRAYFDFESYGRDLCLGGAYSFARDEDGKGHVFAD